jgi:hypothetical protein
VIVTIVQATELYEVHVAMKVDGVTRQLHALLKRSGGYVPANAGGDGESCLFGGGGNTGRVALGELAVERTEVALLEPHGSDEVVELL